MDRIRLAVGITASVLAFAAVGQPLGAQNLVQPEGAQVAAAKLAINEPALRGHIRFLADDLLEGRGPGSRGDELAQHYIAAQFESLGLKPSAPEGGWFQRVPLVGVTTHVPASLKFQHAASSLELKRHDDYVIASGQAQEQVAIENAEIVFVGYGIEAAEYQWDDFKGADLRGKILLVMNNDPADDPELFAGKRRLYYGRWDYKYASAARHGAAGAIIIHTTPSAGYPFQVVQTSWSGEEFELEQTAGPGSKCGLVHRRRIPATHVAGRSRSRQAPLPPSGAISSPCHWASISPGLTCDVGRSRRATSWASCPAVIRRPQQPPSKPSCSWPTTTTSAWQPSERRWRQYLQRAVDNVRNCRVTGDRSGL
jgi:hypothetical protein